MRQSTLRSLTLLAAMPILAALALPALAGAPNPSGPGVPAVAVDADRTIEAGIAGTRFTVNAVSEGAAEPNATVDLTFHNLDGGAGAAYSLYRPNASDPTRTDDAPFLDATAYASPGGGTNVTLPAVLLDRVGRWVLLRADGAESAALAVTLPPLVRLHDAKATAGLVTALRIRVDDATDLGTLTLRIRFDPAVASVHAVEPHVDGPFRYAAGDGVLNITYVTGDVPARSGSFHFATVHLQAAGPIGSSTALDLAVVEAADSSGRPFQARAAGGTFVVGVNGDANGDGRVDGSDVHLILEYVLGQAPTWQPTLLTTDLNRDGRVTAIDAMLIQQHLEGRRPTL